MGVQIAHRGAAVVPLFLALVAGAQWMFPSHAKVQVVVGPPSPEAEPKACATKLRSPDALNDPIRNGHRDALSGFRTGPGGEPACGALAFPAEAFPVPNTGIQLDPERVPTLGDPAAPNRFACLFDYTCHHCRMLHGFIHALASV